MRATRRCGTGSASWTTVREQQGDPFLDDDANRAAGLVAHLPHADWGVLEQPGALWRFGDLAPDEIRALVADGVAVAVAVALDLDI